MTNTTTITLPDGSNVTFKDELLKEYRGRAFDALTALVKAQQDFKEEVEALLDGIKATNGEVPKKMKSYLSKYLKKSFNAEVKAVREEADLFEKFDQAAK